MVDRADLAEIAALNAELSVGEQVMQNFDLGGRIVAFTVSGNWDVSISTVGWSYPEQMVDTIKQLLNDRKQHIIARLAELGVSI